MRKKIVYVMVALLVGYSVLCLIGPSVIKVERSLSINASADAIKLQITDYNAFSRWSPWADKDTAMKIIVEGEAGQVGHKYAWEGNKDVGKGTMELVSITADTVAEKLYFSGKDVSDIFFVFKNNGAATNVTWVMNMNIGFFGRGAMLFFQGKTDKMIGTDYEVGLKKLKTVMEAMPTEPVANLFHGIEINEVIWTERNYFGKKATVSFDQLNKFLEDNFLKILNDAINQKLEHTGPPSGIFYTYDEQKKQTKCVAVISVPNGQELKGWEKFNIPASEFALFVACKGNETEIKNAHQVIGEYMTEKGFTYSLVIEEYLVGPMSEPDSTKWLTNIYYIINSNNGIQVKI